MAFDIEMIKAVSENSFERGKAASMVNSSLTFNSSIL
jgi:hypothetical protein